jgi:arylsulfatase
MASTTSRGTLVGMDVGSPIDFTYKLPFEFTGTIDHVTVELGPVDAGKAK